MADLDDLILDQSIRRRVGEPGRVTRVGRAAESPLAEFRMLAERTGSNEIELVTVTDGIPGHFSLRGRDRQTVVFHERQVEVCAFLYSIMLEQRFDTRLMEAVFEGTVLRLMSEFLLQRGHADQALATLAKSRRVQGGIVNYEPTIDDLQSLERDERYLVEWFFALGHEIGHNLTPELARSLGGVDYLDTATIAEIVNVIIENRFSEEGSELLKRIIRLADTGNGPLSHASIRVLREEAVADLFSLICMSEAWRVFCLDEAGRGYSPEQLLLQSVVSMSSVMIIEQCRIMAGWFSSMSDEAKYQPLMLAGVALQARMNLLRLVLLNPGVQEFMVRRYPSLEAFSHFDEPAFTTASEYLESRSLQFSTPFQRAREFLSSAEMRDAQLLQDYFEMVETEAAVRFDARNFLRVARHLDSPMLDALRHVVDGGLPPIVTRR